MNPDPTQPAVSYASNPVSFTGGWKANDPRTWIGDAPIDASLAVNGTHTVSASGARDCVPDPLHNLMTAASPTFVADTTTLAAVSVSAAADLVGAGSARLHGHIDPSGFATGAAHSGQLVLTNLANPSEQHSYATPPLTDKTTPLDFTVAATGLNPSTTYSYRLLVPSVNGLASQSTVDTLTTVAPAKLVVSASPPATVAAGAPLSLTVQVQDQSGNRVIDDTSSVTLAIGANPSAGMLGGTVTVAAVGGNASFSGLSIDKAGKGYSMTASDGTLTGATSNSFEVTAPTLTSLSGGPTTPYPTTPTVTITATIAATGAPNPGTGSVSVRQRRRERRPGDLRRGLRDGQWQGTGRPVQRRDCRRCDLRREHRRRADGHDDHRVARRQPRSLHRDGQRRTKRERRRERDLPGKWRRPVRGAAVGRHRELFSEPRAGGRDRRERDLRPVRGLILRLERGKRHGLSRNGPQRREKGVYSCLKVSAEMAWRTTSAPAAIMQAFITRRHDSSS